jgi:hypothetical protein
VPRSYEAADFALHAARQPDRPPSRQQSLTPTRGGGKGVRRLVTLGVQLVPGQRPRVILICNQAFRTDGSILRGEPVLVAQGDVLDYDYVIVCQEKVARERGWLK